jgi:hypothetical protein
MGVKHADEKVHAASAQVSLRVPIRRSHVTTVMMIAQSNRRGNIVLAARW